MNEYIYIYIFIVPNTCLAATLSNTGVALKCDYSDESCGYMGTKPTGGTFPKMGAMSVKVCKPDVAMKGVCSCGCKNCFLSFMFSLVNTKHCLDTIYPKYTDFLHKPCVVNKDCQTATDTTAVCNSLTGLCVLASERHIFVLKHTLV
jgi:hypothetical protein